MKKKCMEVVAFLHNVILVFNVFLLRDHIKSYLNGMPALM